LGGYFLPQPDIVSIASSKVWGKLVQHPLCCCHLDRCSLILQLRVRGLQRDRLPKAYHSMGVKLIVHITKGSVKGYKLIIYKPDE
jgi:hypothetical protein